MQHIDRPNTFKIRLTIPKLSRAIGMQHEVMVTAGANQAFVNLTLTLLDPKDGVVLFAPYYFNHLMAIQVSPIPHCESSERRALQDLPDFLFSLKLPRALGALATILCRVLADMYSSATYSDSPSR